MARPETARRDNRCALFAAGGEIKRALTVQRLEHENLRHRGTAAVSAENRSLGFQPAFVDRETHAIYVSRFTEGWV